MPTRPHSTRYAKGDAAAKDIEAKRADFNTAMGFLLNSQLHEPQQTLALFDRIKADKSQPAGIRDYLLDQAIDQPAAKRYKDVISGSDAWAKVRERIARHEQRKEFGCSGPPHTHEPPVSVDGAKYYEGALGIGETRTRAEGHGVARRVRPDRCLSVNRRRRALVTSSTPPKHLPKLRAKCPNPTPPRRRRRRVADRHRRSFLVAPREATSSEASVVAYHMDIRPLARRNLELSDPQEVISENLCPFSLLIAAECLE